MDGNNKTGLGKRIWENFEKMKDLLAGDPTVAPIRVIGSLEGKNLILQPSRFCFCSNNVKQLKWVVYLFARTFAMIL